MGKYKNSQNGVLVLLSGGVDSTACVSFYLEQGYAVNAIFVDYGQIAVSQETIAASAIADHFSIPIQRIGLSNLQPKGGGVIRGRNTFLISLALLEMQPTSGLIALGIHAGTAYWDCSKDFVRIGQEMFDAYTGGQVQLAAPFLGWSKRELWEYCLRRNIPIHLTYSCELGLPQPCGQCQSCHDSEALHVGK
jgi:7-cyano-7-deazaguanine synthase